MKRKAVNRSGVKPRKRRVTSLSEFSYRTLSLTTTPILAIMARMLVTELERRARRGRLS